MKRNNQSNAFIKWLVIAGDFILLNVILLSAKRLYLDSDVWSSENMDLFIVVNNFSLLLSQYFFSTIIHKRLVGAGDIVQRIVRLTIVQSLGAYLFLRLFSFPLPVGWIQFNLGTVFFILLLIKRIIERWFVRLYRDAGRNTRTVTFVGSDPELMNLYIKMKSDSSLGYNVLGYYSDSEMGMMTHSIEDSKDDNRDNNHEKAHSQVNDNEKEITPITKIGTMSDFLNGMATPENLVLGDELYVCLSRRDKNIIRKISRMCDSHLVRFFYIPVSVESLGLNLKREMLDDIEVFTTYDDPLQNPINRMQKRTFDIVSSLLFLIPTALLFPFIFIIIKIQSPGPILFKQKRTGLDGKDFEMLKFRSMHVNADADKVQATKDDPRKYPFGNFMRKYNIDELPQFLNVLKGDMSIVGPRPHMLAHTEMYSNLIDKYMVRHFVKPGVTGWAQVTGFRGETKELWQMEGRVKRDIWYIENWSFWLDVRIIWMTLKTFFKHDENAY